MSDPDLKAITVFLAATATPERGGLPYLDAVLPAEHRLAATRVLRDLGALPPDAILYLLAQPLLDLAGPDGHPEAGEPIQYDELRIEHDQRVTEIVVYNRAVPT